MPLRRWMISFYSFTQRSALLSTIKNHKNMALFFLFLALALIGNSSIIYYNYDMDDAWMMGVNHIDSELFSKNAVMEMFSKAQDGLLEQWTQQHRFVGLVPPFRVFEANVFTDIRVSYFLNLLFHGLNSFFLYKILTESMNCEKTITFFLVALFALGINVNSGSQALVVWIGSSYVNYLTLIFMVSAVRLNNTSTQRFMAILVYLFYVIFAIADYTFALLVPAMAILLYMHQRSVSDAIKYFLLLMTPVIINLIIISFAPPSTYVGTTANFDPVHILTNMYPILFRLIGGDFYYQLTIIILMVGFIVYGLLKRKIQLLSVIVGLSLMFGMIVLYSLSARDIIGASYFLYIPYTGFIMLLALAMTSIVRKNNV